MADCGVTLVSRVVTWKKKSSSCIVGRYRLHQRLSTHYRGVCGSGGCIGAHVLQADARGLPCGACPQAKLSGSCIDGWQK